MDHSYQGSPTRATHTLNQHFAYDETIDQAATASVRAFQDRVGHVTRDQAINIVAQVIEDHVVERARREADSIRGSFAADLVRDALATIDYDHHADLVLDNLDLDLTDERTTHDVADHSDRGGLDL